MTHLKVLVGGGLVHGHALPCAGDEDLHSLEVNLVVCCPEQSGRSLSHCSLETTVIVRVKI